MTLMQRTLRSGFDLFAVPMARLADPAVLLGALRRAAASAVAPTLAIALFVGFWALAASQIETTIGRVPGPAQVAAAGWTLIEEHRAERAKEAAFDARMAEQRRAAEAEGRPWKERRYAGAPTFADQIAHEPGDGVRRLRRRRRDRTPARDPVRHQSDGLRGAEPADPALPAGLAARLAADRDDPGERALPDGIAALPQVVREQRDHRRALLAVARRSSTPRSASRRSTAITGTSRACCGCRGT